MKSNNKHLERINTDILRVLTIAVMQKITDENLTEVHILRVETSADMSEAKIYVNGGVNELERVSGFLRNEIAQNIKMRQAPRLRFIVDKGIENAARVEELLAKIYKK